VTLSWVVDDGVETSANLTGPASFSQSMDWQTGSSWEVGLLPAGNYTLKGKPVTSPAIPASARISTFSTPVALPVVTMNALPEQNEQHSDSASLDCWQRCGKYRPLEISIAHRFRDWTDLQTQPIAGDRQAVF